jgi:nucleoside-diphosphate-sugar epimerase
VRAFARVLELPTTIARLNVCYGPTGWGGLPVELFTRALASEPIWLPADGSEVWSSPISTDDVTHFAEGLWEVASSRVTIVNLAGDEAVTLRECMSYLADAAAIPVEFVADARARESFVSDNTRRKELLGDCSVPWQDGMRRAVEAHFPGVFAGGASNRAVEVKANVWDQR